ncbi:MAG: hypothetical protein LBK65_02265 [Tannerellaceae bacterium]|jgi:hypothetical protein|nr:hypothetical protein [Tannerellaceae bacterium]
MIGRRQRVSWTKTAGKYSGDDSRCSGKKRHSGGRLFGVTFISHNICPVLNGSAPGREFSTNAPGARLFADFSTAGFCYFYAYERGCHEQRTDQTRLQSSNYSLTLPIH